MSNSCFLQEYEYSKSLSLLSILSTMPIIYKFNEHRPIGFGTYGRDMKIDAFKTITNNMKIKNLVQFTTIKINWRTIQIFRINKIIGFKKQLYAASGGLCVTHCNKYIFTRIGFCVFYILEYQNNLLKDNFKIKSSLYRKIFYEDKPYDYIDSNNDNDCVDYSKYLSENFSIDKKKYPYKYIFNEQKLNFEFKATDPEVIFFTRYLKYWIMHLEN